MLGALCARLLKPLMKNFLLITITMRARTICTRPMAKCFPSSGPTGQPHIMWPIEKYMSTRTKPIEEISLIFRASSPVSRVDASFMSSFLLTEAP